MCEQSEGSLVPLVAWRVRYLRSLQTAPLPEKPRTSPQSKSKKRRAEVTPAVKSVRKARSAKSGGKTSAAGA
jgi:hypothetical protein